MRFTSKIMVFIFFLLAIVFLSKIILVKQRVRTDSDYAVVGMEQFRRMPLTSQVITQSGDDELLLLNLIYNQMNYKEKCVFDNHLSLYEFMMSKETIEPYAKIVKGIHSDMVKFPVDCAGITAGAISYEDSWGTKRSYGGARIHEGCDIMPPCNVSDYYPIVSASDGTVEKLGWLKLGGYRIGVRSPGEIYFYYAHLSSYGDNIKEGTTVKAGDILGYMGDTGYGPEGTSGKFKVHLHFGIYGKLKGQEISVNPYPWLRFVDLL